MSEHDTPMDALDRRLTTYLQGRAEMAATLGPRPEEVAAAIAGGAGRTAFPRRRAGTGLRSVPTLAWALLVMGMLAAMALALGTGGNRDNGLVVLPPVSLAPAVPSPAPAVATAAPAPTPRVEPVVGLWDLDFPATGIDNTYGGVPGGDGLIASRLWLEDDGRLSVSSGGGGGCSAQGAYTVRDAAIAVTVPTTASECEDGGPGPAAREIRRRLSQATRYEIVGGALRLYAPDGRRLLVYGRLGPTLSSLGPLSLDFEASGVNAYYTLNSGPKRTTIPIAAGLEFAGDTVSGGAGGGGGCDSFSGGFRTGLWYRLRIDVPTLEGHCGDDSPDLEIRQRLARTARYLIVDDSLQLLDASGNVLLVYRPVAGTFTQ